MKLETLSSNLAKMLEKYLELISKVYKIGSETPTFRGFRLVSVQRTIIFIIQSQSLSIIVTISTKSRSYFDYCIEFSTLVDVNM